ncbi:homocysteine S-methyltransferase [Nesidiocoris tenuis]|uniref:Homocysteine S-methyltransferase n=1 Tax=Nesidiocoris tenuis TaxID=355587 RepID=A0ABN7ABV5_9HEMI|nr:homocysteine S-methyltransferase [Nesidiocoris tenuis]
MADPILLDGGFSTELSKHISERIDGHPLWTARFLITNKSACLKTHREFLKAGAQILRTNTYQASADGFIKHMGVPPSKAIQPIIDSVTLCRTAIELEKRPDVIIGGSIGPIGAWRGDGSEYTGDYSETVSREEYMESHRHRVEAIVNAGVELLCFETIPCSSEALALIDLLKEYPNVKAWISFSCKNETQISNGENFAEVALQCWRKGKEQLVAVGVNCMDPYWVSILFRKLKSLDPTVPFIAYPNSGEKYDTILKEWVQGDNKKVVADYVPEWLEMGITYVGGCCRNSSNEIKTIGAILDKWRESREE